MILFCLQIHITTPHGRQTFRLDVNPELILWTVNFPVSHWRELPQVCFSGQDQYVFVATTVLSRQRFCRGKHTFVAKTVLVAVAASDTCQPLSESLPPSCTLVFPLYYLPSAVHKALSYLLFFSHSMQMTAQALTQHNQKTILR